MLRVLFLAIVLLPGTLAAQTLDGAWVFQSPNGPVRLSLQQQGAALTGSMVGADGNVFALQGTLEEGRATGSISVGGGAGWFALGMVGQQLKMVVAEVDPTTGQPDLSNGWELDFTRVGGPQGGGPASPPSTSGASAGGAQGAGAAGGVPPQAEDSPIIREWLGHLRGRKLSFRESYNSSDARGFGGYSNRWDAWLCSDGTFFFQQRSRVSLDTGGAMGNAGSNDAQRGIWRVAEYNGQVVLQYKMDNSEAEYGVLSFQNGSTYLDRNRIFVTDENPYCR